ncbi:SDR family NAD(P)-dependent oxidoreductase [Chitinophaga sp. NPDC101104]|uniref:SDR family NAD(P)-dependent oxidoreductase n=1 Tax=Chitinophaga sp. NPDC101104 TaxID=3390561 RepID=UPI003CFC09DC
MHDFDLSGKRALITGGGSGLGLAVARAFAEYGAEVIIAGRRADVLDAAAAEIGGNVRTIVCDLAQLDMIPDLVDGIESAYGPLDVLVNNAGIHLKKDALDVTDTEFETVLRTNLQAVFALSREVARRMTERRSGSIIMISSMAAKYGIPKVIAYTAAKAAVEGMTKAMAVEWSAKGVRINSIAPGFIETDMSAKALNNDPDRKNRVLGRTPMQKLGKPKDVALAAVFLASAAAGFITGTSLAVDGGNSIGF